MGGMYIGVFSTSEELSFKVDEVLFKCSFFFSINMKVYSI